MATSALALQLRAAPVSFGLLVATSVAGGLGQPIAAELLRRLLDAMAPARSGHATSVLRSALLLIGVAALLVALQYVGSFCGIASRRRAATFGEQLLFTRAGHTAGLRHVEDPAYLDKLQLAEQGAINAPATLSAVVATALRSVVMVVGYIRVLVGVWPPGIAFLLVAAAPAVAGQIWVARRRLAASEEVASAYRWRHSYRSLLTSPAAAKEIRLFGLGAMLHERLVDALDAVNAGEIGADRSSAVVHGALAVAGELVVGGGLIGLLLAKAPGHLNVGDVTFYMAAMASMQGIILMSAQYASQAGSQIGLFRYFLEIQASHDDLPEGTASARSLGTGIALKDVWFRYSENTPWAIRGVSLSIPPGSTIGIVGPNGSGKSTLVKLLCRFYDPTQGSITWDGQDVREFQISGYREKIGGTFQDFAQYDLTASENIGVGDLRRFRDAAAIEAAASVAGVAAAIGRLPKGFDTLLTRSFMDGRDGSRGAFLSGGEWQRIGIARGLMRDAAELFILDEPSAGLDPIAEYELNRVVVSHSLGRTTLVISHRLAVMRHVDQIFVLHEGQVVEQGTHETLMASSAYYSQAFAAQAEQYETREAGEASSD